MFYLVGINAKYIHTNPAVYYLKAYSEINGGKGNVSIAEYTINNSVSDIISDLYKRRPSQIAFSCYIWNYRMVKEVASDIHKLLPDTDIWLGGPEVSYNCEKVVSELPFVKGIMIGEGEITFSELVNHYYNDGLTLSEINGLFLPANTPSYTGVRELIDFDMVPFPYNDLSVFENKIIYYESSRGCPFRCSYCLSSIDKRLRIRSIELVRKELQVFLDGKVMQVKFVDRTFNCDKKHSMAVWEYLRDNDNGVTNFHFEIAADIMDDEEIELLNTLRPGLVQLEIGVQSTNCETLEAINRKTDFAKITDVVNKLNKAGNIHIHLDLIAGLPHEDLASFKNSFDDVYSLHPDQLQLGFLKVLHGTSIEDSVEEYGIVAKQEPPYEVLMTKYITYDDVILLKRVEEMVEMYYNSNQFPNTIAELEKLYKSMFSLYEDLAKFYEDHNYFTNYPARSQRYKIFLNFIHEHYSELTEVFRETLIKDYLLRESGRKAQSFEREFRDYMPE